MHNWSICERNDNHVKKAIINNILLLIKKNEFKILYCEPNIKLKRKIF